MHASANRPAQFVALTAALAALSLTACREGSPKKRPSDELRIVCTFLPPYVFALNVVGDTPGVRVDMLVAQDVGCPHNYVVRPSDLKQIALANLVIANGLGVEPFLDALVKNAPGARVITISDGCDVIRAASDGHGPHCQGDHDHHEHGTVNAHVWVSPLQAARQVRNLARKLAEADPARRDRYTANGEAYAARLESLGRQMTEAASGFVHRNIVTLHDAFAYLARDLDLNVVATLEPEPGTEPSATQMAQIIDTIKRTRAAAVFYEPGTSDRVAQAVARDAGVSALPLNPFNTLEGPPTARSYEEVMAVNLATLQRALGSKTAEPPRSPATTTAFGPGSEE